MELNVTPGSFGNPMVTRYQLFSRGFDNKHPLVVTNSYLVTIFKGLTIGLQGHSHLSETNLIIKMNETVSAKMILYKSCVGYYTHEKKFA